MSTPSYVSTGTLMIPMEDFNEWAVKFLPPGPFYVVSKPKEKGEFLEVTYEGSSSAPLNAPAPLPVPE